jgi:CheY-like chemotaxis protein
MSFHTRIVHFEDTDARQLFGRICPGSYIEVIIKDTGTGMSPEIIPRIFEPFFTTKEPGKGTGMGLAAVYGAVEAHKGAVNVASAPDNGTTFTLYLPLREETVETTPEIDVPEVSSGSGTILLVEDDPMVQRMTASLLEEIGYQTRTCSNGRDAIACFEQKKGCFDLTILDMMLPGASGVEVFAALRSIDPNARILLYSGYSADGSIQRLLADGNAAFLRKPFTMAEISQKITAVLRTRGAA